MQRQAPQPVAKTVPGSARDLRRVRHGYHGSLYAQKRKAGALSFLLQKSQAAPGGPASGSWLVRGAQLGFSSSPKLSAPRSQQEPTQPRGQEAAWPGPGSAILPGHPRREAPGAPSDAGRQEGAIAGLGVPVQSGSADGAQPAPFAVASGSRTVYLMRSP